MLATLPVSIVGLLMLGLFALFYFLGIFSQARAILAFTGTCLLGTVGYAGGLVTHLAQWAVSLANHATSWAFGVASGAILLTVITAVVFIHDLMPRHTAGKRTGWAGLVLALLLVTGVSGIQGANSIPGQVRQGVTTVQHTFGG